MRRKVTQMRKSVLVMMLLLVMSLVATAPAHASCVAPPGPIPEDFVCCDVMVNGRWADQRCGEAAGGWGGGRVLPSPVDAGTSFPLAAILAGIGVIGAGLVGVAFAYRSGNRDNKTPRPDTT